MQCSWSWWGGISNAAWNFFTGGRQIHFFYYCPHRVNLRERYGLMFFAIMLRKTSKAYCPQLAIHDLFRKAFTQQFFIFPACLICLYTYAVIFRSWSYCNHWDSQQQFWIKLGDQSTLLLSVNSSWYSWSKWAPQVTIDIQRAVLWYNMFCVTWRHLYLMEV